MLTEEQYFALRKYRDSFVSAAEKPDDMTVYLCQLGLIRIKRLKYNVQNECMVTYIKTFWEPTPSGIQALNDFEHSLQKQNDKIAEDHAVKKAERRFNLFNTVLGAVLGAILALLAQNLPVIFEFFSKLLQ